MDENIVTFGGDKKLVGIVSLPPNAEQASEKPGIILLDSGTLHRVGPHRLFTDLARELTVTGFITFRFDFSGIGDSKSFTNSDTYEKLTINETMEAMTFLSSKTNVRSFIIVGLCSGADIIHPVTVMDTRVIGGILLDAYGYNTHGYNLHHYRKKVMFYTKAVFSFGKWKTYIKKTAENFLLQRTVTNKTQIDFKIYRSWPIQQKTEADILAVIQRNVKLLYIYSGGVPYYYNYKNQFNDMFPSVAKTRKVHVEYIENADHTYTIIEEREKLFSKINTWVATSFPAPL
jgi:hypothetical protein